MFKKISLTAAALFGLLLLGSAKPAKAEVHFGVYLGAPAAPVYTYPADPYAYPYDPYANSYAYPYAYTYPAPAYVAPYYSYGWHGHDRDHDRHEWREHNDYRGGRNMGGAFRGYEGGHHR